ncbi:MAG: hypothetical protein IJS70_06355 [Bacteroidales bacterium]|nr:hypothetical protein [Bacteroidales bacterium]
MAALASSCEEDPHDIIDPVPVEDNEVFDLYVCAVKHGGMGQNKNGTFVRRVSDLSADAEPVSFEGKGIDITQSYTMESITRGKYYYQVPQEATGGFVKFHIVRNVAGEESIVVDAERPFKENTYYPRKYTHAWIDDGATLLIVGTDADHKIVFWSKLAESDLMVKSEGTLDIPIPDGYETLSTSGLLTVRPTDGKLFYFYLTKPASDSDKPATHVAVIDPSSMRVIADNLVPEVVMEETVSAAYGELMQTLITYDERGTMYVTGMVTIGGTKYGVLRRIKAGEETFDPEWNGFPNPEGRLLTVQYLGGGKILAYSRDETLGTKIDSRSHFYTIIDTEFCTRTRVSCNGAPLRLCSGRYSQRTAVSGRKAYIGVTEGDGEDECPMVYIYDIISGTVEEGVKLSKGFCFDIIRVMSSDED